MNPVDTAKAVLAKASFYDSRMPTPDINVARAWAEVLGTVNVSDALAAVAAHYTQPGPERVMPCDVLAGVRRIRSQRVKDNFEDFPELDAYVEDSSAWVAKLRELRGQVADGTYRCEQKQLPATYAQDVQKMIAKTVKALPAIPKKDNGDTARVRTLKAFEVARYNAKQTNDAQEAS